MIPYKKHLIIENQVVKKLISLKNLYLDHKQYFQLLTTNI